MISANTIRTLLIKVGVLAICVLVPVMLVAYIDHFVGAAHIYKNILLHSVAIAFAVSWGIFISYTSFRCYLSKPEPFSRYLTLGIVGQTIIYTMHGILTYVTEYGPMLWILYGPVSHAVLAGFVLKSVIHFDNGVTEEFNKKQWFGWIGFFVALIPITAAVAISPLGTEHYTGIGIRVGLEIFSIILYVFAIGVYVYRKINTPLMFLYLMSIILFIQSSATFIKISAPWTHEFWLAHIFFAAGFFILNCGLLRALNTSTSFSDVFTEDLLADKLEEHNSDLRHLNAALQFQTRALDEHAIVSIADVAGDIIYVNDKFCAISGYDREELIGNNHKIVKSDEHPDKFFDDMWDTISSGKTWHGEIKNVNKSGEYYWVLTTIVPSMNDKGIPYQYTGIRTDITARKQQEFKLREAEERALVLARTDHLTGLANRKHFTEQFDTHIKLANRENLSLAMLALDLDKFKKVNDTHGHPTGDALLVAVSEVFKKHTRASDIVSRLGGDEFAILLVNPSPSAPEFIAQRIIDEISDLDEILGNPVEIGISIGVCMYPDNAETVDSLLGGADKSLYVAKNSGRNKVCFAGNTNFDLD